MRKRNISARDANFLLKGKNIPYTGFDTRMRKRVNEAKKLAEDRGETINKEYFYPKKLFREILKEFKKIPLKTEEKPEEPGIIDTGVDMLRDLVSEAPQQTSETSIQTPPLPASGQPIVRTAAANVNPNTNLTRTQEALLSPEEKVIASRRV